MALPNDMSRISESLASREASNSGLYTNNPKMAARRLVRRTYVLRKLTADAMAADATAYTAADQIRMPVAGRLLGANILPTDACATDATDFATIIIEKGDGLGGAGASMASYATSAGALAAGVVKAMTVETLISRRRIAKGEVLSFAITKGGAGKVVPILAISVDVEEEDADDDYAV